MADGLYNNGLEHLEIVGAGLSALLNYMHNNPCSGIWNLATGPIDYLHSSARFYETGKQGIYEVTNYKELDNIDLYVPAVSPFLALCVGRDAAHPCCMTVTCALSY